MNHDFCPEHREGKIGARNIEEGLWEVELAACFVTRSVVRKYLIDFFFRPVDTAAELVEGNSSDCTKESNGNGIVYQSKI